MEQVRSQSGVAMQMQEHRQEGLDQAMGLSEADGVLLMELLEDSPPVDHLLDDDADRLSHVIRSLEAEIDGGVAAAVGDGESTRSPGEDGGRLEEMLLDLDGYDGAAFGYWPEVPPVGHEVGGWYVYTEGGEGSVVACEVRDHQYYYADQGSVEQVYSPLWECE